MPRSDCACTARGNAPPSGSLVGAPIACQHGAVSSYQQGAAALVGWKTRVIVGKILRRDRDKGDAGELAVDQPLPAQCEKIQVGGAGGHHLADMKAGYLLVLVDAEVLAVRQVDARHREDGAGHHGKAVRVDDPEIAKLWHRLGDGAESRAILPLIVANLFVGNPRNKLVEIDRAQLKRFEHLECVFSDAAEIALEPVACADKMLAVGNRSDDRKQQDRQYDRGYQQGAQRPFRAA